MSTFDPYREWLEVRQLNRPLDYYQLLGLTTFTPDPQLIRSTAESRLQRLRPHLAGPRAEIAQRLLQEISAAAKVLLSAESRAAYDQKLKQHIAATARPAAVAPLPQQPAMATAPTAMPHPAQPVMMAAPVVPQAAAIPQAMPYGMPQPAPMYATPQYAQPFGQPTSMDTASPVAPSVSRTHIRRKSNAGSFVVAVLLLLLVTGGLVAFVQRDVILAMINDKPTTSTTRETPAPQPAGKVVTGKVATPAKTPSNVSSQFENVGLGSPAAEQPSGLLGETDPSFADRNVSTNMQDQRRPKPSASSMPGTEPTVAPGMETPAAMSGPTTISLDQSTSSMSGPPSGLLGTVDPSFSGVNVGDQFKKAQEEFDKTGPANTSPLEGRPVPTESTPTEPEKPKVNEKDAVAIALRQAYHELTERNYDATRYQIIQAKQVAKAPESLASVEAAELWLKSLERFWEGVRGGIKTFEVGQHIQVDNTEYEIKVLGSEKVHFWIIRGEQKIPHMRVVADMQLPMLMLFAEKGLKPDEPNDRVAVAAFLAVEPKGDRALAREMLQDAVKRGAAVSTMIDDLDKLP